jgi:hypothetical protein
VNPTADDAPDRRKHRKIVYESWLDQFDIEEAIAAGEYTKTYLLADGTVSRVDMFDGPGVLFKVSYRDVPPPYDGPLAEHQSRHPGALSEFWAPAVLADDGTLVVRTCLYEPDGTPGRRFELHRTAAGQTLRQIEIGPGGERLREERPIRGATGEVVGYASYDTSGALVREYRFDDD